MNKFELLHFTATWCQPCKKITPIILSFIEQNVGLKYTKIDVDKSEDLVKQYDISSVPTLIVLENGEIKSRRSGVLTEKELQELFL
jgi:thioredoxin 1